MPDLNGFDHEPHRGAVYCRCIHCGWPGWGVFTTQAEREKHARTHAKERQRAIERQRLANLQLAQRLQRQAERENEIAYAGKEER
jgi:hypothetical protein